MRLNSNILGGNLDSSRKYFKIQLGPLFYSYCNCPLTITGWNKTKTTNLIFLQHEHEQQLQRLRQKTAEYELEIAEVKREKVEAVSAQTLQKLRNGSSPSSHQQQEVGGATNGRSPSLDGQDAEDINDMSRSLERVSSIKITKNWLGSKTWNIWKSNW